MSTLGENVRPLRPPVAPADERLDPPSAAGVVALAAALSGFLMGCFLVGAFWILA